MSGKGTRGDAPQLTRIIVSEVSLDDTLRCVAEVARTTVITAVAAGVTLLDDRGRPITNAASSGSPVVEDVQHRSGERPTLDAHRRGSTVRVDDVDAVASMWPAFAHAARGHGVRSAMSVPLVAGTDPLGTLDLYASAPAAFTAADEEAAAAVAAQGSVVIANARAYWGLVELTEGLRLAMRSRAIIEQAKGKLMAMKGCSAEEAFDLLVGASQRENVKLRDVARRVVEDRVD